MMDTSTDEEGELMIGSKVELRGLNAVAFNGKRGLLATEPTQNDGRRKVEFTYRNQLQVKRIKEENIFLVCSQCSAAEPTLRCSLCHGACYCSAKCQSAHWALSGSLGHRGDCSTLQKSGDAERNRFASTNSLGVD
mmetsp:Transcript_59434/g.116583  ORF Transcript_59434/g.116583 Transcript_59434/m.116583 type:complete len:136 (-) Transcript_59434:156-563(-)